MAKNWIQIDTIYKEPDPKTRAERARASKRYKSLMAKTSTLSVIDLKKKSNELYTEQKLKEASLLEAYNDNRLKSEKAIKQAIRIKKERAKKNDAKQDTEKVPNNKKETTESSVLNTPLS